MHSTALIPLLAILVSAAFGAVSIAWDSGRHPTRRMAGLFVCTGVWGLLDLMTYLEPGRAALWIRWMPAAVLMLGPSVAFLLLQMFPAARDRFRPLATWGLAASLAVTLALVALPSAVEGAVANPWGGMTARFGWPSVAGLPLATVIPVVCVVVISGVERRGVLSHVETTRVNSFRTVVVLSLVAALTTDYLIPVFGGQAPRLGAMVVATATALMWLRARHVADDLLTSPDGLAQSMLDELHDGIVLIHEDGTIAAASKRFTTTVGWADARLVGTSLAPLVDMPLDEILAGIEDRKTVVQRGDGGSLPVSVSSTIARDHRGEAVGAVVVFRDLREIDALERRLLTSGRLAAIGELAAGIAHEINNPVAFIRSDLHLLARRLDEIQEQVRAAHQGSENAVFPSARRRIDQALAGVERVAEVVGDVRSFAHMGGMGQGGSDPALLVEGAMRLARLLRGDDVELRVRDARGHAWIESGQELKQILLALALALCEGSEKGGVVESALDSDGETLRVTLTAGRLADGARRMSERFERLSTTGPAPFGTDFGLSVAAELMSQLDASLELIETGPHAVRIDLGLPLDALGSGAAG
jgi:PAS domain S-box-containing protein